MATMDAQAQEALDAFKELAARLFKARYNEGTSNFNKRLVRLTDYEGAYGQAGTVLAIEGSPPRGTFVTAAYHTVIYINAAGHARRLPPQQADVVFDLLAEFDRIEGYPAENSQNGHQP